MNVNNPLWRHQTKCANAEQCLDVTESTLDAKCLGTIKKDLQSCF